MCISSNYVEAVPETTKPGFNYPEHIAKTDNPIKIRCSRTFVTGHCAAGHVFIKSISCGKEYCDICGQNDSETHNRRINRWWGKVMSMKRVGYLVITVPDEVKDSFKDKKILTGFRVAIRKKLQRMGYNKGLMRWHWFGDCRYCKGNGCSTCNNTGAGSKWHPHLNILIESGFMSKEVFSRFTGEIKSFAINYMQKIDGVDLSGKGNVFYDYCKNDAMKVHRMKYVLRSTFRIYNFEIAKLLKNYSACSTFGDFEKCTKDREGFVKEILLIEKKICPCCGASVSWKGKTNTSIFFSAKKKDFGSGYYQLLTDA